EETCSLSECRCSCLATGLAAVTWAYAAGRSSVYLVVSPRLHLCSSASWGRCRAMPVPECAVGDWLEAMFGRRPPGREAPMTGIRQAQRTSGVGVAVIALCLVQFVDVLGVTV